MLDIKAKKYTPKEGLDYYITEDGRVFKECKPKQMANGYMQYQFGRGHARYMHRLVCELWNGPPEEGQDCRHLDGTRTNNHASNLAWGSRKENAIDMANHGTQRIQKLMPHDVEYIRSYPKSYGYRKKLARMFDITEQHITDLRRGNTAWQHLK